MLDGIRDILLSWVDDIGGDLIGVVSNIVSDGDALINTPTYNTIFEYSKIIGMSLLTLYFLLQLVEDSTRDTFTMEHFIRACIKLILGKEIIDNLAPFITGCVALANNLIPASSTLGAVTFDALKTEIRDAGVIDTFAYLGMLLVPWLVSFIIRAFVYIAAYTRTFEIGIRAMFLPLAVADIFNGGLNSSGIKSLKRFFAACVQGALMVAVVAMGSQLNNITITSGSIIGVVVQPLIIGATTAAIMAKTQQWASEIIVG